MGYFDIDTIILTILYLRGDKIKPGQLLSFIKEYYEEILKTRPVHKATVYRHLQKLIEKGYVNKVGYGRRAYYEITDKGREVYLNREIKNVAPLKDAIIKHLEMKCGELKYCGDGYFNYFKCLIDDTTINIKIIGGVFFTEQMKNILKLAAKLYAQEKGKESKPIFIGRYSLYAEILNFLNKFRDEKGSLSISIRELSFRGEPFLIIIVGDNILELEDEIAKWINKIALTREGKESLLYGAIEGIRRMIEKTKGGIIIFTGRDLKNALNSIDSAIERLLKLTEHSG